MQSKTVSTRMSIIGRGANCRGGRSAVEQSAYISRTTLYSEYYAETYYPKYAEDLVCTDILLPPQAPESYKDRAVLWNSVEAVEKNSKAQLARLYKVSLPNRWNYGVADEFMRDYIHRNFVSKGMCAEYAIHDSVNKDGVHNFHCHIMLTMRPILENGEWGDKQKKVYKYDAFGNKIRKANGRYDCSTVKTTDWDNKGNARKWRKDLVEGINSMNMKIGNRDEAWEWRSFKERGLDLKPTIHLGEQATALERKGIHTDKGDYNRDVQTLNALNIHLKEIEEYEKRTAEQARREKASTDAREIMSWLNYEPVKPSDKATPTIKPVAPTIVIEEKDIRTGTMEGVKATVTAPKQMPAVKKTSVVKDAVKTAVSEVLGFIRRVAKARGWMTLPKSKKGFFARLIDGEKLADPKRAEKFVIRNKINTFAELDEYVKKHSVIAEQAKNKDRKEYRHEITELAIVEVIQCTRKDIIREEQIKRGRAYEQRLKETKKPEAPRKSFADSLAEKEAEADRLNAGRRRTAHKSKDRAL